jgi:hypothetical protein
MPSSSVGSIHVGGVSPNAAKARGFCLEVGVWELHSLEERPFFLE